MSVSKSNEKAEEEFEMTFHYYRRDLPNILRHEFLIRKFIKEDRRIPAKLVKGYISFFDKPSSDTAVLKKEIIEMMKKNSLLRIKKIKHDFSILVKVNNDKERIMIIPPVGVSPIYEGSYQKYNLTFLLNYYGAKLNFLQPEVFEEMKTNKKLFIEVTYNALREAQHLCMLTRVCKNKTR